MSQSNVEILQERIETLKDSCSDEYPWTALSSEDMARMLVRAGVLVIDSLTDEDILVADLLRYDRAAVWESETASVDPIKLRAWLRRLAEGQV